MLEQADLAGVGIVHRVQRREPPQRVQGVQVRGQNDHWLTGTHGSGGVTLVSMGFFQSKPAEEAQGALVLALIVAGIVFIATLLIVSLLLLVVDPAQVATPVDRPVLYDPEPDATDGPETPPAR